MATTITTIETPGASTGTGPDIGSGGVGGEVGVTPGGVTTVYTSETTPVGKSHNYTVVVTIPVPFLNLDLNLDLLGNFVLPTLSALGVPKAYTWLITNANKVFQHVIDDATKLIKAIPEATVTILIKLGTFTVFNIQLVARKEPMVITPPTFLLALPNLAVDLSFDISFPAPPPVVIYVPIPVPVLRTVPLITTSGGQVVVSTGTGVVEGRPGAQALANIEATPVGAGVVAGVDIPMPTVNEIPVLPSIGNPISLPKI
jgi:hypothetical protein